MALKVTKPAPMPLVIDHVNGMTSIVTNAGMASSYSSHGMSRATLIM